MTDIIDEIIRDNAKDRTRESVVTLVGWLTTQARANKGLLAADIAGELDLTLVQFDKLMTDPMEMGIDQIAKLAYLCGHTIEFTTATIRELDNAAQVRSDAMREQAAELKSRADDLKGCDHD